MRKNLFILLLGLSCVSSWADEIGVARQSYEGTPYLTGGIGEEELQQVNAARPDFNVRLLMAEKNGAYVSDVNVVIVDSKGNKVLEVGNAGPYLLARLPKGGYKINASYGGRSQDRRLDVRDGAAQALAFYW